MAVYAVVMAIVVAYKTVGLKVITVVMTIFSVKNTIDNLRSVTSVAT